MPPAARALFNAGLHWLLDTCVAVLIYWDNLGSRRRRAVLFALGLVLVYLAGLRPSASPTPTPVANAITPGACTDETPLEHGCARVGDAFCLRSPASADIHPSVTYALRAPGLVLRPAPGAKAVTIRLANGQTASAFSAFVALEGSGSGTRAPVFVEGPAALCLAALIGA